MSKGNLYIIAAPSGGGKTTLVNELVEKIDNLFISISYTTRPKRAIEKPGKSYHYVDEQAFKDMVEQGIFLEYASVFGHLYGTPRNWVEENIAAGHDVILEIDWQGARAIKLLYPDAAVSVFIVPPSRDAIQTRLHKRAQDAPEIIESRMEQFSEQMSHYQDFDYIIINDDFKRAYRELESIVIAQRLTLKQQFDRFEGLIKGLLENEPK